ncbi:MAG: histidine phosphatase family protein [Terriglobia bacterium]
MLWLIRHGETEWSLSGAHTGRSDIPLTAKGEEKARGLRAKLSGREFGLVLVSPLKRARRTCELAGFGAQAQIEPNLLEWNYGSYEGRTTEEIQKERPGWSVFRDGVPDGERIDQVADRASAAIARALGSAGDTALFAHAHILRILTARWLRLAPEDGSLFALDTGSISTLGYERETRVIRSWNG